MNLRRYRLGAIALAIAVALEVVFAVADPDRVLTRYLAVDAPAAVGWLHAWRPFAIGVRLAIRLGYRFDKIAYKAPWQFWAISEAVGLLLTAAAVWLVLWLWTSWRARRRADSAKTGAQQSAIHS